jgi:hypothetical protein
MDDKNLPAGALSTPTAASPDDSVDARRRFLRQAALVAAPFVLTTVNSRTVWARQTVGTTCGSCNPSAV